MANLDGSARTDDRRAGWAVLLSDAVERAVVEAAAHAARIPVTLVSSDEQLEAVCGGAHGAIIEVGRVGRVGRQRMVRLVQRLRDRNPRLDVVVVQRSGDVSTSWTAMRSGARPWCRPAGTGSIRSHADAVARLIAHIDDPGAPRDSCDDDGLRRLLELALRSALDGRPGTAISLLCRIHRDDAAVDALTDLGVELLGQLEWRSRYSIPLCHVVERLEVDTDEELDRCVEFLDRLAVPHIGGAAGRRSAAGTRDDLYAAFQSTTALIRFAAARWWTSPDVVLDRHPLDASAVDVLCTVG